MFARTERLLLRPGWSEDAPALFQAIADERIVRNLASAPWPYSLADAEAFLARERDPREPTLPHLPAHARRAAADRRRSASAARRPARSSSATGSPGPTGAAAIATEAGRALIANARDSLRLQAPRRRPFRRQSGLGPGAARSSASGRPAAPRRATAPAAARRRRAGCSSWISPRREEAPARVRDGGLRLFLPGNCRGRESGVGFAVRRQASLRFRDQVPVVMLPGVEAGQEESEPGAEDLAQHARPTQANQSIRAQARGPVMPSWRSSSSVPQAAVDDEVAGDEQHHLRLDLPALRSAASRGSRAARCRRRRPCARSPRSRASATAPRSRRRRWRGGADCSSSWWARIAVKCSRHMVAARLTIGGRARVIDSRHSTRSSSGVRS